MARTIRICLLFLPLFLCKGVFAQEVERPLIYNPFQMQRAELERSFSPKNRGGGSLQLPFFDDFSRYSLPTNDPNIPLEWQRWEDDDVYINNHFPVEPISIGVATFDGLQGNGYPYNFNNPDAWGPADTLTSLPINLDGFSSSDNVYLSFYYQPEGLGNDPDPSDALYLDFFRATDQVWIERWSVHGSDVQPFQQVFVPVSDSVVNFFNDGFRFRFRNEGTLSGNLDHWHLDYVYLDQNIDTTNLTFVDLAVMDSQNTLLEDYTAMPWSHFKINPSSFMKVNNAILMERALDGNTFNFQSGFSVAYNGQVWDMPNANVNTSGTGIIETTVESVSTHNFTFDTGVNDTCAVFDVKFYHEISDDVIQNDTTQYQQNFTNFYAYDDGSAERAYALNEAGAKVAVKFRAEKADSLLGLFIHFTPFRNNNEDELFFLRAWEDAGGFPGNELALNYSFHSPNYYTDGYNIFAYYAYDQPIYVEEGPFFVGVSQDTETELNYGNDKNTNRNPESLFYQLGLGSNWTQSSISGSVMIRPVFQAGKNSVFNGIGEMDAVEYNIFPNPTSGILHIQSSVQQNFKVEVYDINGRLLLNLPHRTSPMHLDLSFLDSGFYSLKFTDEHGGFSSQKFVKQ